MAEKLSEKKITQWSTEETEYLLAIWTSADFQQKLKSSTAKSKL